MYYAAKKEKSECHFRHSQQKFKNCNKKVLHKKV